MRESIALLSLPKMKKRDVLISLEFSIKIFDKTPIFSNFRVFVPLLFEKKITNKSDVSITNSSNNFYISNKNQLFSNFRVSAPLLFEKKITNKYDVSITNSSNNFYISNKNQLLKKEIQMNSFLADNSENVINYEDNQTFIQESAFTNNNQFSTKESVFPSQATRLKTTMNYLDGSKHHNILTQNNEFVKNTIDHAYRPENKSLNFIQDDNNAVEKVVKNFVYKSENKVENRLQEIENKIVHMTENESTKKEVSVSEIISKEEREVKNHELHSMSEKVYTLVVKKLDRERARKGDLYA